MGKSSPQPPPAPDPTTIINSQTAANKDTAQFQSVLNNNNYSGPQGTVSWNEGPSGQWTQNVYLSPSQQKIYDLQAQDEAKALDVGSQQADRVEQALGHGLPTPDLALNINAAPNITQGYNPGGQVQTSFALPDRGLGYAVPTNTLQNGYSAGGPIQTGIGPSNFGSAVQDASNAAYSQAASRLDPQWGQSQEQLQAQLTAQGLSPNSAAWQTAMQNFQQAKTDAYNQANYAAVQAGDAEQAQLFGQQQAQAQFANAAQQQQFGQNQAQMQDYNNATLGQFGEDLQAYNFNNQAVAQAYAQSQNAAQFANQAQQQQYAQNQGLASFQNTAQQQDFNEQAARAQQYNSAQQQNFQNLSYVQNLPLNQLTGLMGLGQVALPTSTTGNTSVAPVNVDQAYQLQQQGQQFAYNANQANAQSSLGGLFNLGTSVLSLFG